MRESSIVALVAVVVGALASVASVWFSNRARQRDVEARAQERREDYEEWYRRTLFEKQLHVVQESYAWLMEFNRCFNLADPTNPDEVTSRQVV